MDKNKSFNTLCQKRFFTQEQNLRNCNENNRIKRGKAGDSLMLGFMMSWRRKRVCSKSYGIQVKFNFRLNSPTPIPLLPFNKYELQKIMRN